MDFGLRPLGSTQTLESPVRLLDMRIQLVLEWVGMMCIFYFYADLASA